MKLFFSHASPYSRKVRVALAEKRIDCEAVVADVNPVDNAVNAHNPLGKIPTLVLDDGTALFDSRVIVDFLDNASPLTRLIPEDNRERVAVRRLEALADGVLDAGLLVRYEAARPQAEQSAAWSGKQLARMKRGFALMAGDLGDKPWAYGERYTLADVAFGCCFGWLDFRKPGGVDWRAEQPRLARHYDRLMERPAFAETAPR